MSRIVSKVICETTTSQSEQDQDDYPGLAPATKEQIDAALASQTFAEYYKQELPEGGDYKDAAEAHCIALQRTLEEFFWAYAVCPEGGSCPRAYLSWLEKQ